MGLNTRFRLSAKLKAGTPNKIIKPLLWLVSERHGAERDKESGLEICPCPDDDPFFRLGRCSQVCLDYVRFSDDEGFVSSLVSQFNGEWDLEILTHCKNYDRQIEAFLLWLSPWIVSGEGTSHVEGFYMERDIVVTSHGITISRSNYGNLLE